MFSLHSKKPAKFPSGKKTPKLNSGFFCRFLFLFFLFFGDVSLAQVRFGLILSQEQSQTLTQQEIETYQRLGFTILAPEGHFAPEIFDFLNGQNFEIWPVLPQRFLIRTAQATDAAQQIRWLRRFEAVPGFNSIIAGWHADLNSARTSRHLAGLSEQLREAFPAQPLYLITKGDDVPSPMLRPVPDAGLSLPTAPFKGAPLLLPPGPAADEHHFFVQTLREGIRLGYQVFLTDYDNLQIYLDDDFSGLAQIISGFQRSPNPAIPLPAAEQYPGSVNYGVLILIGLWLSFAIHMRFNPNYSRTVGRYFFNHSFLVEDILRRHILLSGSVLVVFLQAAVMWGLFSLTFITSFLGEAGMQALSWYFPVAANDWFLFTIGLVFGALFNGLLWAWLIISCFRRDVVSMSATLLFWPMHLGLFLLLVLLTLSGSSAGSVAVLAAGGVFVLVQLGSFLVAAAAFGRQPTLRPAAHLGVTFLLYLSLLSLLAMLFVRNSTVYGIMQLAFWLNN